MRRYSTPFSIFTPWRASSARCTQPVVRPSVWPKGVGDRFGELLLAGDSLRQVELPAQLAGTLEERHRMASLRGDGRRGQARGSAADDCDALFLFRFLEFQFRFPPGAGIDDATCRLADEVMVEAGLVAGNADV